MQVAVKLLHVLGATTRRLIIYVLNKHPRDS